MLLGVLLLGTCFLPGARHHLLSTCALNRVQAAVRDQVNVAHIDGYPEVNQRRDTQLYEKNAHE